VGFSVGQRYDLATDRHVVVVSVALTMAETNALFLSGDTIIGWPEGGDLAPVLKTGVEGSDGSSGPSGPSGPAERSLTRTGMFVSELARLAQGLEIGYRQSTEADRAAQLIRLQLLRAGIKEVS
jgi:hypothetical protein